MVRTKHGEDKAWDPLSDTRTQYSDNERAAYTVSMSSLACSGHENSMHNPLVWIEISALTDQSLTLKMEGASFSCFLSTNC